MTVEKLESGKRYERGMRYKISFCNGEHVQYLTEMAFLELGREITTLQNTSSNKKYTVHPSDSPKS